MEDSDATGAWGAWFGGLATALAGSSYRAEGVRPEAAEIYDVEQTHWITPFPMYDTAGRDME